MYGLEVRREEVREAGRHGQRDEGEEKNKKRWRRRRGKTRDIRI